MSTKILVADDEKPIIQIFEKIFSEDDNLIIHTAANAQKAIKMLNTSLYSVIITDLVFPGKLSGLDILKAAKARSADTEVIVMTGFGTIQNAIEATKLGAYDYLSKPIKIDELKLKVDKIIEMKQLKTKIDDQHESILVLENSGRKTVDMLELKVNSLENKISKVKKTIAKKSSGKLASEIKRILK